MTTSRATSVSLDQRSQDVVDGLVRDGRYASAEEVVREGLRLVEANEAKLQELRATLNEAIAKGGSYTSEDVMAAVKARLDASEKKRAS